MTLLTIELTANEVARLARVYKRPDWMPQDATAFAREYHDVLVQPPAVSAEQLVAGVTACKGTTRIHFPKPGELRAICKEQRVVSAGTVLAEDLESRYRRWEGSPDAVACDAMMWQQAQVLIGVIGCPVCQAHYELHVVAFAFNGDPVERFECWHDHDQHLRTGIGYSGRPRGPKDRERLEAKLVADRTFAEACAAGAAQSGLPLERVARLLRERRELPTRPPGADAVAAVRAHAAATRESTR